MKKEDFSYHVNLFLGKTIPKDQFIFNEYIGIHTILWNQIIRFRNDFNGFTDYYCCFQGVNCPEDLQD